MQQQSSPGQLDLQHIQQLAAVVVVDNILQGGRVVHPDAGADRDLVLIVPRVCLGRDIWYEDDLAVLYLEPTFRT